VEWTKKYVSFPSNHTAHPSPHSTGGSIDLSILDEQGKPLDMGTNFDEMTSLASTRSFEQRMGKEGKLNQKDKIILENRRCLYHCMTQAGFTNYHEEWWHFDYGNQFWGKATNQPAMYGIAHLNRVEITQ
jgi:D-alanyl-D-alanine dipeptidase